MASVKRDSLPEFWVSNVAKVLSGDQPCQRELWMKAHYRIEARPDPNANRLQSWKADHSALLQKVADQYRADGWQVDLERFIKVIGQFAVLTGKVDLIARKKDFRPLIVDVKTGKERDSDRSQVMIEMVAIPMAWNAPSMIFDGAVHGSDRLATIAPHDANELKPRLFALLKRLGTMAVKPEAAPSGSACRFCSLNDQDCGDRFVGEEAVAETALF